MLKNFVPLPYRRVSVQPYAGPWTEAAIREHLLGRDSYRRTDYVILHQGETCCIVAVKKATDEPLFAPITDVEILALPQDCRFVEDAAVDTANRSALAAKARELGMTPDQTLVVRGRYEHTNFIHRPDPVRIQVIEVMPPESPKLYEMAKMVLQFADLPAIELELNPIRMEELAAASDPAPAYLIPCRASGLELEQPVHYLDEHPEKQDWVMIGCERSCQIHNHFYGHDPERIDVCPRNLRPPTGVATLAKCCLLETHIEVERDRNYAVVPWGAELHHVEAALRALFELAELPVKQASEEGELYV